MPQLLKTTRMEDEYSSVRDEELLRAHLGRHSSLLQIREFARAVFVARAILL